MPKPSLVTRKRLEPDFPTRRSQISGHVSAGLADIGGLVAPGGEGAQAAVQALYTVFVDLSRPADVLDAALIAAADGLGPLRLLVSRHGAAPLTGLVRSSDVIVDPGTGYACLRIEADTPDLTLLPGMFARASVPRGVLPGAPLVPGEAVLRTGRAAVPAATLNPPAASPARRPRTSATAATDAACGGG